MSAHDQFPVRSNAALVIYAPTPFDRLKVRGVTIVRHTPKRVYYSTTTGEEGWVPNSGSGAFATVFGERRARLARLDDSEVLANMALQAVDSALLDLEDLASRCRRAREPVSNDDLSRIKSISERIVKKMAEYERHTATR